MNVRILVLGILMHRPAHGYEIQQYMQLHEVERWADILPGSTYHALKKMRVEGLVEVARVEFEGKRSREVYAITEAGKAAFQALLLGAWQSPQPSVPINWYVSLPFWNFLEQGSLRGAIQTQLTEMKFEFNRFERELETALEPMPDPFVDLVFANVRAHFEANVSFLQGLWERLEAMKGVEFSPLELPPLEELLDKFPHLRERMKVEPRKGVKGVNEPSQRRAQSSSKQDKIARMSEIAKSVKSDSETAQSKTAKLEETV